MAGYLMPENNRPAAPRPSWLERRVTAAAGTLAGWGKTMARRRVELSYDAARFSIDRPSVMPGSLLSRDSSRYQRDRVQLMREARHVAENIGFAAGLKMLWQTYLFANLGYEPDTGDAGMDSEIADYMEMWMGQADARLQLPFQSLFGLTFVGGLIDGDAGLVFVDDGPIMRLMPVEADQIGEINSASIPELGYVAGRFLNRDGTTAGWRVYSRTGDMQYTSPQMIPAQSFVYLSDARNVSGSRGVSCLATLIDNLKDKHAAMGNVKTAIADQTSKSFTTYTERGTPPPDLEMNPVSSATGRRLSSYLTHANNAVTEYFGIGEQMVAMENKHVNDNFLNYVKMIDQDDCLGINLPYGFVVNQADAGGAGVRIVAHMTSREFTRMISGSIRPKLNWIRSVVLGHAIEAGELSRHPNFQKGAWMFPPPPTADMQRESDVDIKEVAAGMGSRTDALAPWGLSFRKVVKQLAKEAAMRRDAAEAEGVPPDEVFAINPKAAPAPNGNPPGANDAKPPVAPKPTGEPARMSAHMGDVAIADLPAETQADVRRLVPGALDSARLPRYGMTYPELVHKADSHNLATARGRADRMTRTDAAEEVHRQQDTKHVLLMNDKIVDGHHYVAKAERGRVTNSLNALDLTPARLATEKTEMGGPGSGPHPGDGATKRSQRAVMGELHEATRVTDDKGKNARVVLADGTDAPEHIQQIVGKISPERSHNLRVSLDPNAQVLAKHENEDGSKKFSVVHPDLVKANADNKFARVNEAVGKGAEIRDQIQGDRQGPHKEEADAAYLMEQQATRPGSEGDTKGSKSLWGHPVTKDNFSVEPQKDGPPKVTMQIGETKIPLINGAARDEVASRIASGKPLEDAGYWIKSHGATTLEGRHVVPTGNGGARLQFMGKEAVWHDHEIKDKKLAAMLLDRKAAAGDKGQLFKTNADKVGKYVGTLGGGGLSNKDLRTKKANELARDKIASGPKEFASEDDRKEHILKVAAHVSGVLGNQPAQALSSYIDSHHFDSLTVKK